MARTHLIAAIVLSSVCTSVCASIAFANDTTATASISPAQAMATIQDDVGCKQEPADSDEHGYRITDNSVQYKGLCVDTKLFRPLVIKDILPGKMIVRNFRHQDSYWEAEIPTAAAAWKTGYMQIIRFPVIQGVIAAHGELRFKLADGYVIKLKSQSSPGKETVTDSFVFSVEAGRPKDVAYNFAEGAIDNYILVGRVVSGIQRMNESKNPIEQYTLKLDQDSAKNSALLAKLVSAALQKSQELGMKSFYNTVRPNCVSEALDLIDKVRGVRSCNDSDPKDQKAKVAGQCVRKFYTVMWVDPVAGPALAALKDRQILGDRYKDLQGEYSVSSGPVEIPPTAPNKSMLRELTDRPFALVAMIPKSGQSAAVVKKVQDEVDKTLTLAVPRLSSAAIVPALVKAGSAGVVSGVVKYVQSEIGAMIDRINPSLPEKGSVDVIAYLTPWDSSASRASLVKYGVAADLPFNYVRESEVAPERIAEVMKVAQKNMLDLQTKEFMRFPISRDLKNKAALASNPKPAFLIGLVVRIRLQRDASVSTIQTIMSMVPQDLPFKTYNTVDLDRVHIPAPSQTDVDHLGMANTPKATMIMTHVQFQHSQLSPELDINFGKLEPFQNAQNGKNFGLALTAPKPALFGAVGCGENFGLVPEMRGVFYPNAFGAKPRGATVDEVLKIRNMTDAKKVGAKISDAATSIHSFNDAVERAKNNNLSVLENDIAGKPVALGIYSLKFVKEQEYCWSLPNGSAEKKKFCGQKKSESGYKMWDMDIGVRSLGQSCLRLSYVSNEVTNEGNGTVDGLIVDAMKKTNGMVTDTIMGAAGPNAALLKTGLDTFNKLQLKR
jgi:hypothetical protein